MCCNVIGTTLFGIVLLRFNFVFFLRETECGNFKRPVGNIVFKCGYLFAAYSPTRICGTELLIFYSTETSFVTCQFTAVPSVIFYSILFLVFRFERSVFICAGGRYTAPGGLFPGRC